MNPGLAPEHPPTTAGARTTMEGQPQSTQTLEAAGEPAAEAPIDLTDPSWQGAIVLQQSPWSLVWLATAFTVPSAAALTGYVAAGPAAMVGAGVSALLAILTLDHQRPPGRG